MNSPLLFDAGVTSSCHFSANLRYRYWLERTWDENLPRIAWCMLNPSTADETQNDPTIERVMRRSKRIGYGGIVVVNLFAIRSTDPHGIRKFDSVSEPKLPKRNDFFILNAARSCRIFVAAWGTLGEYGNRAAEVVKLLDGHELWCLGKTKSGHPRHPLYVAYGERLRRY